MIIILDEQTREKSPAFNNIMTWLAGKPGVTTKLHKIRGARQTISEIYLIGDTATIDIEEVKELQGVERVIRVSQPYRILGRHEDEQRSSGFTYQGLEFSQDSFQLFAGLCAVDTPEHVELTMKTLHQLGLACTRMGAYKPRTNPYSFQGLGADCLAWVFELAGKYGIKVIAMEITHENHIDEIQRALRQTGHATGVMLQVGTRNTQNFELLKAIGKQSELPVLLKRGFGITLEESLNAAEYLASEGNERVVFCLRGVKSSLGDPHRNLVDFAHVPVVKRMTRMPVCVDPSHSVGRRDKSPEGLYDLAHATVQGVIAGANMVLLDVHPHPAKALVDGPQALTLEELPYFCEEVTISRDAWIKRKDLAASYPLQ